MTLPLKPIEDKFKVLRARKVLQLRESVDPKVYGAGVVVKAGRKWKAEAAVEEAESRLCHGGHGGKRKDGLGTIASPGVSEVKCLELDHKRYQSRRADQYNT